jgi:glycosyltransferase involved in cell wall biosynthesis
LQCRPFAIFVGGAFYANVHGIEWFIKNVVPFINIELIIIGRGFELLKNKLEVPGKVSVVGDVASLDDWYNKAHFVVAPIFDGSGMKTKVAEALMYGKKIVGSVEAFTGYDAVTGKVGWICKNADEFIMAIKDAQNSINNSFDLELRILYEEYYSNDSAYTRLVHILNSNFDEEIKEC